MSSQPQHEKPTSDGPKPVASPSISLPKGGGAIRGIGEKFAANPVTGTGSMSIPIATSPGRSGFGSQLNLSYDSGSGNGPFGFGWSLSIPSITRKTDKGLPQYWDADESDVFILSGAEDLVPEFRRDAQGNLVRNTSGKYVIHEDDRIIGTVKYRVRRYRPRIEGLFARIERWTNLQTGDTHWRSITRDNIITIYGKDNNSKVFDPIDLDPQHPSRIFSWLICASFDDKGNAIHYEYAEENSKGINTNQVSEKNRSDQTRTANRYIKQIRYGNTESLLSNGQSISPLGPDLFQMSWLFEVVFDYDEGHYAELPLDIGQHQFVVANWQATNPWTERKDPISTYRAGFEVRTYRLCRRALMFHHIPNELGTNDYLVHSTEFNYTESQIASFITSITQSGYVHKPDQNHSNRFLKKSMPPLEFKYSQVPTPEELAKQPVYDIEASSLENLPYGLDGSVYQWVDLDGEGTSGILSEQGGAWYYKRNLSANNHMPENGGMRTSPEFGSVEIVTSIPNVALSGGQAQFLDLAGDGQLDVAQMDGPVRGFYERTNNGQWLPLQPFMEWPKVNTHDPNLKFVDLTGDGHADILITEDNVFTWYPSLAEDGFGPAEKAFQALDEEKGPRLVFSDASQSVYLADISGDGLTDLVRIRNGEICYWPNLGYGHFGSKITMDNSPWFDRLELFDQKRIRLADTDGSGTTDILYLHGEGVDIYFNQSGNGWSEAVRLSQFSPIDNLASVQVLDLLSNGTACLVWSSSLPGEGRQSMRYIDLMGEKPHLLISVKNNLGAETRIHYAPSTQFYLVDKQAGKPWITRLPFLVHVVERVETYDRISRNRFVTRYAYHHGYFDGVEREFRGFGMVEQRDTEEFATLSESDNFPTGDNMEPASHVPPVLTKTWFHTGVYLGGDRVSNFFAGLVDNQDTGEYYREPGEKDEQARQFLLDDTVLPAGLTAEEEREACRALKGAMLRQEIYALDDTDKAEIPYTVAEQNFTIECLQTRGINRHSVFFTHPREAISYHYERNPADPRITHNLTLEVDDFGNVLKSVSIGYGRGQSNLSELRDQKKQTTTLITYTENEVTNRLDSVNGMNQPDAYRTPVVWQARTYELTGYRLAPNKNRFAFDDFIQAQNNALVLLFDEEIPYETQAIIGRQRRIIEYVRTLFRSNDLTRVLPGGQIESMGLQGEAYKLAFTPGLLVQIYQCGQENLLSNPGGVLGGTAGDQGGYRDLDGNGQWWIPTGRVFFSENANITNPGVTAPQELLEARRHFFLPRKFADPFGNSATVGYDAYDLLVTSTKDALNNTVTALSDYRVLQPALITDPNGNQAAAAFDALGMVVGTAVMGKENEPDAKAKGDLLEGFEPDTLQTQLDAFINKPREAGANTNESVATQVVYDLLGQATTRIVYDLDRFRQSGQPPFAATITRETHVSDLALNEQSKLQVSFSYSDGFGREIQKKIQAEPGPLVEAGPKISPRWVGSGWTIFNNKGKPVRQYEPFFDDTHEFKFDHQVGVSPILFYDPVERVVATAHPNGTYEKVVFDAWEQITYDVNDTVMLNPKTDEDVKAFFEKLPDADYLPTWYEQRMTGVLGATEKSAAEKASAHANTPTTAYFDTLGRPFLTLAHNGFNPDGSPLQFATRTTLDIEGNHREVIDAKDRVVMRYDYDMLGNRMRQASMEAGERWMLNDVTGKPIRVWDSRGHQFRTVYDALRRPIQAFVSGTNTAYSDPRVLNQEILFEKTEYGENQPDDRALNLRTRLYKHYDPAGIAASEKYDFKGNLLQSRREVAQAYKEIPNWSGAVPTDGAYTSYTSYDALNRPITLITPDNSSIRPAYNEANLLERIGGNLRGANTVRQFVDDIDYNANGQRTLISYHVKGLSDKFVQTEYVYDEKTFRLTSLRTTRPDTFPAGERIVQDLSYTYDPVGNITYIRDNAQQTIYFRNRRVEPSNEYTYDAIYRLIEAIGREHLGQNGGGSPLPPAPTSYNDAPHIGLLHPNSTEAMGTYLEQYQYDEVGNFINFLHHGTDPSNPGWTRAYTYNETSLLEPGRKSNRLTRTTVGTTNEIYSAGGDGYDPHGNMLHMPQVQAMQWDYRDQLCVTQRQAVNIQDQDGQTHQGERTYYVYDATGQRIRKVTEDQNGTRKKERLYLGSFELYCEYDTDGTTMTLERETLHIFDDKQRIALVETKTIDKAILARLRALLTGPEPFIRYQFGNHLGSAGLELDAQAEIISYEEYTPYGSSSYQAVRSQTETPKRYRYTSKERDEESGFYYYGARYYILWLGRWTSCDPEIWNKSKTSSYVAFDNSPVIMIDPDGRKPQIANNYKDLAALKKSVDIAYSQDTVAVTDRFNPGIGTNTLSKSIPGQTDLKKAASGSPTDKISFGLSNPKAVYYYSDLESIEKLSYVKKNISGTAIGRISDAMFGHLASKPTGPTVMIGKEKVTMQDATKNMMLHVFGQAIITTLFGKGAADYAGDIHERDQPSLITGAITKAEERQAIDNYSDMVNNLYGQDIGERLAKKFGVTSSTVWTPKLTADYLNAVQKEIAKEMGWKFKPFSAKDAEVNKFSALLNEVQGITPVPSLAPTIKTKPKPSPKPAQ